MPNQLGLQGGQPQKPTRFAPIYTGRWSSGLWTNRSPLRDATTSRQAEKYFGPNGDALIDGLNTEITNRLTLARRPGNPVFDSNSYNAVDSFYSFRMFSPTSEQIDVMIDEANTLSSLFGGTKSTVFTKSSGAGQAYMQSVGNSLYFGDGLDNKKWLQSLTQWAANAIWNGPTTPFLTTFLIDANDNIQQMAATTFTIASTSVTANVLTVNTNETITNILVNGVNIIFPASMTAAALSNKTTTGGITITGATQFTVSFGTADYGSTAETNKHVIVQQGGFPKSSSLLPTWSTTPLTPGMADPTQAYTYDNTVLWINRGTPSVSGAQRSVENWGIQPPATVPSPTVGLSRSAWHENTYYSYPGVLVDSNGNLQGATVAGVSGATVPVWANAGDGSATTDGTVTWKQLKTAAELAWTAHTVYLPGSFIVAPAGGVDCLFQGHSYVQPFIKNAVDMWIWSGHSHSVAVGSFVYRYPLSTGSATAHATGSSLDFDNLVPGSGLKWKTVNAAGETTGTTNPFPSIQSNLSLVIQATITVPVAGQYTFDFDHHDGMFWGIGGGAALVSGTPYTRNVHNDDPPPPTGTAVNNFPVFGGYNSGLLGGLTATGSWVINFPTAGDYTMEIDFAYWYHSTGHMAVKCNGNTMVFGTPESGTTNPIFPPFSLVTGPPPDYPHVSESASALRWDNIGPILDFAWSASINYPLTPFPATTWNLTIVDPVGNTEAPYETGASGINQPDPFASGLYQLTTDNPNLVWINTGTAAAPAPGTVSTFNGGWQYALCLVNTLDDTVSNFFQLTPATGNFIGALGVSFAAGSGIDPTTTDPQADYVAIFRTTDGLTTPFLIPGAGNSVYTVSLADYLANGYTDSTPDTGLDNLIEAPIGQENTPPAAGAINLTFHLSRIFFSVGNIVYWTSGPDTPVGNGVNGVAPLNFDGLPSLVKRLVPTAVGLLVYTVSDIYIILGSGTANDPIRPAQPLLKGIGLLSYNALDINGSIIGWFTTDKQFIILDPTSGISVVGFPIGNRLRKNVGTPLGEAWNPLSVYVTWHVEGDDQAWYLSDGATGWYRLMTTPAPETGLTWSPFAQVNGTTGCKAVQSIEVSPGVHKLLIGPTGAGSILNRDLSAWADNGTTYKSWAILGSIVLAQPGQVAEVAFITTDAVKTGSPLTLGVLFDEAWPYYTGPFEILKDWEPDPPGLPPSQSIIGQRFYLAEDEDHAAVCRHMQIQVNWVAEASASELLTLTIFGAFLQEA